MGMPILRARVSSLRTRLRQACCGLTNGHDALLHFETGRLCMRCTSCGHETPGWDLVGSRSEAVTTAATPAHGWSLRRSA